MVVSQIQDRRQQLIEAAVKAIAEHGFGDATVGKIAGEVGITSANINHLFGGKANLLEATMRSLMRLIAAEGSLHQAKVQGPKEKIRAIVGANLSASFFQTDVCRAWLQFWAQAPHHPLLQRLEQLNASRLRSNLVFWLVPIIGRDRARDVAHQAAAMIDGFWI